MRCDDGMARKRGTTNVSFIGTGMDSMRWSLEACVIDITTKV